jgi:alkaline phosphatase
MSKIGIILICLFCMNLIHGQDNKPAPVKNIILMIGDGMGVSQIYAGITASDQPLNIEQFKNIGFSKTNSATSYITDSGAGGTAIAIGYKTYDAAIGVDVDTVSRKSILEYAEMTGKSTGIVVTSQVTHATPASFYAHQVNRYKYEEIAADLLKSDIEVFIGGGLDHFTKRKDSLNLKDTLISRDYFVATSLNELEALKSGKLAGLLYDNKPPKYTDGRDDMLPVSTAKAIKLLNQDQKGFFLMVEGSQIDWGGHDNDTDYIIEEMLDFDRAIGKALEFAKKDGNTLLIVTADHETGGMGLNGGNIQNREVLANYTTSHHTAVMVPVFAFGPGAENFRGIYENTELFHKMMDAFGFNPVTSSNF